MDGEAPKDQNPKVSEAVQEAEDIKKKDEKDKHPFGKGVKPALYILFDEAKDQYFVLGAPGFLDDPTRAYGALKIAEKNLDDFYRQKKSFREHLQSGVKNFQAKMNMRRFLNGK